MNALARLIAVTTSATAHLFPLVILAFLPLSKTEAGEARFGSTLYPPEGRVLHIAGQSREDFHDYVATVSKNGVACPMPAGVTIYTNLDLQGLTEPFSLAPGDTHQDLSNLMEAYDGLVLHVALYLHHTQLKPIAEGRYDTSLKRLGELLAETGRPVYLRIGYEFDGPHNQYAPEDYRPAYRRSVEEIDRAGAKNVAYVWHSYAWHPTFGDHDPSAWYPGDAYVSWVGISFFQSNGAELPTRPNRSRLVAIAKEKNLPLMICEASPISARDKDGAQLRGERYWNYWFEPFFEFIAGDNNVRAFCIINCDWDVLSLTKNFGWGDCRIGQDLFVLEQWRKRMHCKEFIHQSQDLDKILSSSSTLGDAPAPSNEQD